MFAWGLRIKIYVPEPTKTIFCENFSFKLVQRTLKEENGVGGGIVCLSHRHFRGFSSSHRRKERVVTGSKEQRGRTQKGEVKKTLERSPVYY